MVKAIGQLLPEAMVIAFNPVAICAVLLLLLNQSRRYKALAYLFGWILGLVLLTCGIYLLVQGNVQTQLQSQRNSSSLLIWAGILFLALAIYEFFQMRRKKPEEPPRLKWLDKLDVFNPYQVFGMGAAISGLSLKNAGIIFSVLIAMRSFKMQGDPARAILIFFTLLGSITIIVPVVYGYIKGPQSEDQMNKWLQWLLANSALVLAIMFLFLAAKMIGAGLAGPV